jgi:hypothetical protein
MDIFAQYVKTPLKSFLSKLNKRLVAQTVENYIIENVCQPINVDVKRISELILCFVFLNTFYYLKNSNFLRKFIEFK